MTVVRLPISWTSSIAMSSHVPAVSIVVVVVVVVVDVVDDAYDDDDDDAGTDSTHLQRVCVWEKFPELNP